MQLIEGGHELRPRTQHRLNQTRQRRPVGDQVENPRLEAAPADLAHLQPEVPQRAADVAFRVAQLLQHELAVGEQHPPVLELKAKVALEALRGDRTLQEIASQHQVHPNQVGAWKRQAMAGLVEVFSKGTEHRRRDHESEVRDLHAKIGELIVERDFLSRGPGR